MLFLNLLSNIACDKYLVAPAGVEFIEGSPSAASARALSSSDGGGYDSIMYEVLADQTMWAVCGRTSGNYYTRR